MAVYKLLDFCAQKLGITKFYKNNSNESAQGSKIINLSDPDA